MRKINPSVKCFAVLAAAVLTAFSFSLKWNLVIIGFSILLMVFSKVNWKHFLAVMLPITLVAVSLFLTMYLHGKSSGAVTITNNHDFHSTALQGSNLWGALAVATRIYAYASMGLLFALTTSPNDFIYSLMQQVHLKPRFAYSVLAAFNLIPAIGRELANIRLAYKVRGCKRGILSIKPAFSALVNTIHWSENLAMAMQSKGFDDNGQRTMYLAFKVRPLDLLFAAALVGIALMGMLGI